MDVKSKKTDQGINVLKFIAVVLIVLIHESFPGKVGLVVEGVAGMSPLVFFMISGYYSYGSSDDRMLKRTVRILQLTICANLIYFFWDIAVEFLAGGSVSAWLRETCSLKKLLVFLAVNESPFRGHLWFLGALLYSYLFALIFLAYAWKGGGRSDELVRGNQVKCLRLVSVVLLILNIAGGEFLTLYGKNIQIPYIRNWLFMGIPFFCMGYCIHADEGRIYRRIGLNMLWLLLFVSILLNIAEVYFAEVYFSLQSGLYITTIFVDITAFLVANRYKEIRSVLLLRLGGLADKYGLWVYVLQIIVIKNLRWLYAQYGIADKAAVRYASPFIALALSFALAVSAVWISGVIKRK